MIYVSFMEQIITHTGNESIIEIAGNIEGLGLAVEDTIQPACNEEVGLLAAEQALKNYDTDGASPK